MQTTLCLMSFGLQTWITIACFAVIVLVGFLSGELFGYLKKNFIIVLFLIFGVLWGVWRGDPTPWNDWEEAAVGVTIGYAIFVYAKLLKENAISGRRALLVVGALVCIILAFSLSYFGEIAVKGHVVVRGTRPNILGWLFFGSLLFCYVDWLLAGGRYRDSYKKALKYSDVPVTIAFLILWRYSCSIQDNTKLADMLEPFFAGAVAFQMMLSNVVWSFTDDPIFE